MRVFAVFFCCNELTIGAMLVPWKVLEVQSYNLREIWCHTVKDFLAFLLPQHSSIEGLGAVIFLVGDLFYCGSHFLKISS